YRKQFSDFLDTPLGRSFGVYIVFCMHNLNGRIRSHGRFCSFLKARKFVAKKDGEFRIVLYIIELLDKNLLSMEQLTIFFLWFALSGWLFRILIFATWVLPFAGPLLIGALANNLVIKGACPACKRQFIGNKNQTVRCAGCGNIVWQPKNDFFSKGGNGPSSSSKSDPNIIDVEFEEK
ncbi:hypothetical protein Tco_1027604, partial [Tanacetum coccineum]